MAAINVRVSDETRKRIEHEAAKVPYRTVSDYVRDEMINPALAALPKMRKAKPAK